jgi:hypothetical protein
MDVAKDQRQVTAVYDSFPGDVRGCTGVYGRLISASTTEFQTTDWAGNSLLPSGAALTAAAAGGCQNVDDVDADDVMSNGCVDAGEGGDDE